jgi:hypothetical protein
LTKSDLRKKIEVILQTEADTSSKHKDTKMSSKISKMKCYHCGGQHKQSKCGQFARDSTMAQLLVYNSGSCYNIAAVPKQILRISVNRLEMGIFWHGEIVKPENDWRSKPLSSFTKKQLIDRHYKLTKSIDKQIEQIVEKNRAEKQETDDVCPICLDSLSDKKLCTSPCGHTFCSDCFIRNITSDMSANKNASSCPCCRSLVIPLITRGYGR